MRHMLMCMLVNVLRDSIRTFHHLNGKMSSSCDNDDGKGAERVFIDASGRFTLSKGDALVCIFMIY